MALLINKEITLGNGLSISSFYMRLEVTNTFNGSNLKVVSKNFISREDYKNGNGEINIPGVPSKVYYEYNREEVGEDILLEAHNLLKSELTRPKVNIELARDPSTGEFISDPSTGEFIIDSSINIYWAMDSSISIVDIDSSIG